ncbi:MAG TPA: HupE/UreJ family protein [Polyangia bacterium]|nr:HupE/UreJ family protein [Polyangia bacterium]
MSARRAATRPWGLACLMFLLLPLSPAVAHQQSATFGSVAFDAGGTGAVWRLRVRATDLLTVVALPPGSRPEAWRARAIAYLAGGLQIDAAGAPCPAGATDLALATDDPEPTWVFTKTFPCAVRAGPVRLRYDLFFERDRFHQSFTLLPAPEATATGPAAGAATTVFRADLREVTVGDGGPSAWQNARTYLRLGVLHILTGFDHLAFLCALLLGAALTAPASAGAPPRPASRGRALRETLTLVSAFTAAHSLTLILQALRPGYLSTRWVEPAIAFSVAYVGIENLIQRRHTRRWLLVFGFGLVHGLGFASVLREVGLPRRGLILSLLAFNLGVEAGQLLVLSLAFPLILEAARRFPRAFQRWGLRLGSALIAAAGLVWLVARLILPR